MHMIVFSRVPSSNFGPKKTGFAPKFLSDIQSAAGELFTGPVTLKCVKDSFSRKGLLFAKRTFIFAKRTFFMAKTIY